MSLQGPSRLAMDRLMRPRSIAVVGASADPDKFSYRPLAYLRTLGFAGDVYPIHPEADEIAGFACRRSIEEIAGPVDVAIIARPAAQVPAEVDRCIAHGIRAFVVFSAGFAEADEEGARLQAQLVRSCAAAGAVLCGPNCTGIADASSGAALTFTTRLDRELAPGGSVALVAGSGSITAMLVQWRGRLFHSIAAIGNEAVTTSGEFIADAVEQPGVRGVVAFLEAIRDHASLRKALQRARELGKPVAILKGGRTARSAAVAATHTGARIDDDAATQAMFEHHGAVRADSIEELKTLAALMHGSATRSIGPRVGVLTPSGGTAVLIVDEIVRAGLALPGLSAGTAERLKQLIPQSSPGNPMDVTGFAASSGELFDGAMRSMLDDPGIDVLLVPMGGGVGKQGVLRAEAIVRAAGATGKLLVPIWQGGTQGEAGYERLLQAGLPVMTDYALPVAALGKLVRSLPRPSERDDAPAVLPLPAQALVRDALQGGAAALSEPQVKAMLAAAGVEVPSSLALPAAAQADAEVAAAGARYPAVLKVVSADLLHKSAVGGVAFVASAAQLPHALRDMQAAVARNAPSARVSGFLLEEMVAGGLELMVGIRRDAQLGTLVSLGLGGTWADGLRGAVTAMLPLSPSSAQSMARSFFAPAMDGAAVQAVSALLLRLGALADALGARLDVLEVNPVRLVAGDPPRLVALDGVLTLSPPR